MSRHVIPAIRKVVSQHPGDFPKGMKSVLLCMDNAPQHTAALKGPEGTALLHSWGLTRNQILPHPPVSPDFSGPVENTHSWHKAAVRRYLAAKPGSYSPEAYKAIIRSFFNGQRVNADGSKVVSAQRVSGAFQKWLVDMKKVQKKEGGWGSTR